MEQPEAGNYLWGCVFSPRDPRAKRLTNRVRIALRTPTASQLTWFWVAMGNTQGSRGFIFGRLIVNLVVLRLAEKGGDYMAGRRLSTLYRTLSDRIIGGFDQRVTAR